MRSTNLSLVRAFSLMCLVTVATVGPDRGGTPSLENLSTTINDSPTSIFPTLVTKMEDVAGCPASRNDGLVSPLYGATMLTNPASALTVPKDATKLLSPSGSIT